MEEDMIEAVDRLGVEATQEARLRRMQWEDLVRIMVAVVVDIIIEEDRVCRHLVDLVEEDTEDRDMGDIIEIDGEEEEEGGNRGDRLEEGEGRIDHLHQYLGCLPVLLHRWALVGLLLGIEYHRQGEVEVVGHLDGSIPIHLLLRHQVLKEVEG